MSTCQRSVRYLLRLDRPHWIAYGQTTERGYDGGQGEDDVWMDIGGAQKCLQVVVEWEVYTVGSDIGQHGNRKRVIE